mgnify:CR=1 FL=1
MEDYKVYKLFPTPIFQYPLGIREDICLTQSLLSDTFSDDNAMLSSVFGD